MTLSWSCEEREEERAKIVKGRQKGFYRKGRLGEE